MVVDINILASSDVHGYYMPWDYSMDKPYEKGSLAQISTEVEKQRGLYKNTILIDAGDMFQGNCSELFCEDDIHPAIVAMNEIGYDIWEMGNHEYGYGIKNLQRFIDEFNGEVIGGNVYKDNKRLHKPYCIIEKEGIKIGFIGLVTSLINKFEKGTKAMSGIIATDMKYELELIEKELKDKVDCIIGVIHAGIDNENNVANTGIRDLLKNDDKLTAVFCGHFHDIQNFNIGNTTILEPGKFGQAIAKLLLRFEKSDGNIKLVKKTSEIIPIDASIKPDSEIIKKLNHFHERAVSYSNEEIGILINDCMSEKSEISKIPQMRVKQTGITDFFLEVVRHYGNADVAMIQLDNDNAGINKGIIRRKDINRNYTYVSGGITSYQITGKVLKKILEYSAYFFNESRVGDVNISFNYERQLYKYSSNYFFSNLIYDIDLTSEKRIKNLTYENESPIGDEDKIIFATTKYTMDILIANVLSGEVVNKIYSSKDELREQGSIRNLSCRYIKEVLKGLVEIKPKNNWKIITAPIEKNIREIAIKLINQGYISLINSEDGKCNIKSVNIYDKVDKFDKGLKKSGIDISRFSTKGELYRYANSFIFG